MDFCFSQRNIQRKIQFYGILPSYNLIFLLFFVLLKQVIVYFSTLNTCAQFSGGSHFLSWIISM